MNITVPLRAPGVSSQRMPTSMPATDSGPGGGWFVTVTSASAPGFVPGPILGVSLKFGSFLR
jgi:hypothetical protein